jgi:hypothetical protein
MAELDHDRSVEDLVAVVRERAATRRAAGEYPPELLAVLDEHFWRMVPPPPEPVDERLTPLLETVTAARDAFDPARIPHDSQSRLGEQLHRTVARLVSRQVEGVLAQNREFATAIDEAVRELVRAVAAAHADLYAQLDAVLERLAAYERAPAVPELSRRLEVVERQAARRRPGYELTALADALAAEHPSRAPWTDEVAAAVPTTGGPPVVVGAHVADVLAALPGARVVEPDAGLRERAAARGHGVVDGPLAAIDDRSVRSVVVADGLARRELGAPDELVLVAADKLEPGGRLVVLGGPGLWIGAPVPAVLFAVLARGAGFGEVEHRALGGDAYLVTARR